MHNLRHLRYIVETARLGSITQASRLLRVSQPAISAAIRACEDEFGIRFFIRHPSRGLALTPSGRTFVKRARKLLDEAQEFEEAFNNSHSDKLLGRLELACYANPAPLLVPLVVNSFMRKNPDVEIGMHEGNMEQVVGYLKSGAADLGLTYDIYLDNDIEFEVITTLAPFAIMSAKNPLAKKKRLSLATLAKEPLVLINSPGFREFFYNYFGMHRLAPHVVHQPTTYEMARGLLTNGKGYSLALIKIKNSQAYNGSPLVNVELSDAAPQVNLVIASLKGYRLTRLAQAFTKECQQQLHRVATGVAARR